MFTIPVLSLLVAFLAVILGPLLSVYVAKKQIASSLTIAKAQLTAPMRQAWINNLRDSLAELTSSSLHYYVAGFEDRTDKEYQRLTYLESKVGLMLNPREEDQEMLEQGIRVMVAILESPKGMATKFQTAYEGVTTLSRQVLKREWDHVKDDIPVT